MKRFAFLLAGVVLAAGVAGSSAAEISDAEFRKLHAELQPDNTALWRTVPWKISVLDGQQTAAEEKKPLFIWAMDGHPLGCT